MIHKWIKFGIIAIVLISHILLNLISKRYITPELIFPAWLSSNAKVMVSEIYTVYPPVLLYLVSALSRFVNNLELSLNLIQLAIVLTVDVLIFQYLQNKFNFKLAVIGILFYIPWQVFFRGNYLWYDLATIPFIIISFSHFEDFVKNLHPKKLLFASIFLSLGYFFKSTVFWIFGLYFIWLILLAVNKNKGVKYICKNSLLLFIPLIGVIIINFLIILLKTDFPFAFYWNIIIQIFVYPRVSALTRSISSNYFSVFAIITTYCLLFYFVITKYSKNFKRNVWFLFSFALVSLSNIFPRWGDFHVQPFLPFFAIIFVNALYASSKSKKHHKLYLGTFVFIVAFFTALIFLNRIANEVKNSNVPTQDNLQKFAPQNLNNLIRDKNVFVYDFSLYNHLPIYYDIHLSFLQRLTLAVKNPDFYYQVTGWQHAFTYIEKNNPEIVVIPFQIHNRIISKTDLTDFEKAVLENYHERSKVAETYFLYVRNEN